MDRRDFIKMAAGGVVGFSGCKLFEGRPVGRLQKPNILLIMADDLGKECLGCYGDKSYQTPNLDKLARTGMRFEHCYSQPLCTPSRVKIMTGKYNFRNYTAFGSLKKGERTFGHVLKKAGYRTCVAGKWQLAVNAVLRPEEQEPGTMPVEAGFDEYCLWQVLQRGSRYADPLVSINNKEPVKLRGEYGPDVFCDYILDFIERNRGEAFFAYYPMVLIHGPWMPTPDSEGWEGDRNKRDVKYFADMVKYMDKTVGRIVSKLDELGLREDTLVIFTGDNGTHKAIVSQVDGEYVRGGKGETSNAGTHVPMIANWRGTMPEGRVCEDLIDYSDFLPTLADVAGSSLPAGEITDGRSFRPQLKGEAGNPRKWVFCYYDPKWGKWSREIFVYDKRWKLYGDGRLFDLERDPLEENPLKREQGGAEAREARSQLEKAFESLDIEGGGRLTMK